MGSLADFVLSSASDAALPLVRQTLEDVVMETLNERQVPTRTDFRELRDVVNQLRGQVTSVGPTVRKLEKLVGEHAERLDALEARIAALEG